MKQSIAFDLPIELKKLAQTRSIDGLEVFIRCFWVPEPRPHYELFMTGQQELGIVDVPVSRERYLDDEIEEAAICFATSLRLRQQSWS